MEQGGLNMSENFKIASNVKKEQWSDFVATHIKGNIFQTPEMYEIYKNTKRYDPAVLAAVDENDNIQALLLAHVIREFDGFLGSFSSRSIIQGDPLFVENEVGKEALKLLLQEYDKIAKEKALYTEIRNLHDNHSFRYSFDEMGYNYNDHLNFLVDLTKPKEDLWKGLSKKRRNDIKRAKKRGVTIKEIEDKHFIPIFYDLIHETYKFAKLPLADISLFDSVFDSLVLKKRAKFLLAEYEDNYIGAILILIYKERIYDWYAGACRDYLRLCPNDLLAWHAIEWGSENGYHTFDFGGAGKPDEEYGVRDFKKQFGGKLVNFGRYTKVHSAKKLWIAEKGFVIYRRLFL